MKRRSALRLSLPQDAPSGLVPVTIAASPRTEWVTITPHLARQWIADNNSNNRAVREVYVKRLATDMVAGKWKGLNGEAIRFDVSGRLVDGQHRLLACIEADRAFDSLLVTGLDSEVYSTIGIGAKKNFSDFLGPVHGEKNVALLAAAIRLVCIWQKGSLGGAIKDGSTFPTIAELEMSLAANPGVRQSANFVASCGGLKKILTPSYAALIHYAATTQHAQSRGELFLSRLSDGLALESSDPVYQLRKFLLSQKSSTPGHRRAGQAYVLALAIKAWNSFKDSKPMVSLRLASNETFPVL